jgi:NTE family protein
MSNRGPDDAEGAGDDVGDFLASVPLFAELSPHLRQLVSGRCRFERVPAGSWLFHQHDEGGAMFIVRRGRLAVVREGPPSVVVGGVGPGEAIGELSLLIGEPRSASARTIRDCELLRLDREDLDELLGISPDFAAGLLQVLGNRVRYSTVAAGERGKRPTVLSVVRLDPSVPVESVRDGVVAALAARRTVTSLDGTEVERDGLADDELDSEWARLLDRLEREHDHVVLVAPESTHDDSWTRFCVRHGDRVAAVTRPNPHVEWGATPPGSDVLLWTAGTDMGSLGPWLEAMKPRSHHFVDPRNPDPGLARAARRLTSRSLGVVLCGGGARALASIGVLDELSVAGLAVDRLAGSGFGALVAAMFALGMPPSEIARRCRSEFVQRHAFNDFTAPRVALLRGRRFAAVLVRVFGDAHIEQLTRSFFCVSADMGSAELVVHRRGRLATAVGAAPRCPVYCLLFSTVAECSSMAVYSTIFLWP